MHVGDRHLGRAPSGRRLVGRMPGEPQLPLPRPILEHGRGVAVLLVLQQSLHEVLTNEFDRLLGLLGAGYEGSRLDFQEHAGELHKLPHLVDGQIFEHVEVGDELAGDHRDRHLRHIHLVFFHEVQQEVHRTGEDVEIDLELHARPRPRLVDLPPVTRL